MPLRAKIASRVGELSQHTSLGYLLDVENVRGDEIGTTRCSVHDSSAARRSRMTEQLNDFPEIFHDRHGLAADKDDPRWHAGAPLKPVKLCSVTRAGSLESEVRHGA